MDKIQHFKPSGVLFLGEQDGPHERDLKSELSRLFIEMPSVRLAFLTRVSYRDSPAINVALCIYGSVSDPQSIVATVSAAFRGLFGATQHLDIVFLSNKQLEQIAMVANAFYQVAL